MNSKISDPIAKLYNESVLFEKTKGNSAPNLKYNLVRVGDSDAHFHPYIPMDNFLIIMDQIGLNVQDMLDKLVETNETEYTIDINNGKYFLTFFFGFINDDLVVERVSGSPSILKLLPKHW